MRNFGTLLAVLAAILLSGVSTSAQAQQPSPTSSQPEPLLLPSNLEISAIPYFWLPWTSTSVHPFNPRISTASNTIDPYQLVSHLTWVPFMGAAEIRDGPLGLVVDYLHAPLKAGVSTRNVLFGSGGTGLTIDTGTAMFLYRTPADPVQYIDVGLGMRSWGIAGAISLSEGLLPPISVSSGLSWADPLFGLRYHRDLGDSFATTFYGDVGGFGIGAHIDWQILATIDYALQPATDLHVGFRSLNFNYAGARAGFDVHMYGPIVSATFQF
jgi:hypothetical protein